MTNPTPNSLSPQGEHAPGPKPLSPAAQEVLDAVRFEVNAECFAQWLAREMPPNTIIGDPLWWAPRIWRAALERWGRR